MKSKRKNTKNRKQAGQTRALALDSGSGLFVVIDMSSRVGDCISKEKNPTKLHQSLASAKTEADRLACANIGRSFAVFACAGLASSTAPTPQWRKLTKNDIVQSQPDF